MCYINSLVQQFFVSVSASLVIAFTLSLCCDSIWQKYKHVKFSLQFDYSLGVQFPIIHVMLCPYYFLHAVYIPHGITALYFILLTQNTTVQKKTTNKQTTHLWAWQECALEMGQYRLYRYRYNIDMCSPKISTISISFTAALFGLLTYFIMAWKVVTVTDVNVIPQVPFRIHRRHQRQCR